MIELLNILVKLKACQESLDWLAEKKSLTFTEAWNSCSNYEWLGWLIQEVTDEKSTGLLVADIATTALRFVPVGEDRPRLLVEAAQAYANYPTETNYWARENAKDASLEAAADHYNNLTVYSASLAASCFSVGSAVYHVARAGVPEEESLVLIRQHFPAEDIERLLRDVGRTLKWF